MVVSMNRIYVPTGGPEAWRQFLAKPELQWAQGYSARTLASCWEAADGLPPEIADVLEPSLGAAELLVALPEHKTVLPGGRRESQSDVFGLLRAQSGLVAMTVEGKVDEPFGPTVAEWLVGASPGKRERLQAILDMLGVEGEPDGAIRYQLLHRTAAAVLEAQRFTAAAAAMVVHSFSPTRRWHEDYRRFAELLGLAGDIGQAETVPLPGGKPLHVGWACGDERFLKA